MKLFDTHAHLQDARFNGMQQAVLQRSLDAGVIDILSCGVQERDWQDLARLARQYPSTVFPAFGLHPWFIASRSRHWLERLEQRIRHSTAAVGEIGLDRMVTPRDTEDQVRVFLAQLDLARSYERPVSIHCRKAFGLLVNLLEKNGGLPHGGILHSYSGPAELVRKFEKLGAHLSFSGAVTRPRNKKAHQAARIVSPNRLLIETDAPDLLPTGAPAGHNEPAHVRMVLHTLARLRNEPLTVLASATYANATTLLTPMEPERETEHNRKKM